MKSRLWYPQLDPSSAVRRFARLLRLWSKSSETMERLFIADFFLASPNLIDRLQMPSEYRKKYTSLGLPKPKDSFLTFPSSSMLFHTMEPVQKEGLNSMAGKALLELSDYEVSKVKLSDEGLLFSEKLENSPRSNIEDVALEFISDIFQSPEFSGKMELRTRSGLRFYD